VPLGRPERGRQGEEKQDGCGTCTKHDALPGREGRPQIQHDVEADGLRGALVFARRKLRGPETNPNPHRHGRHPKDKREDAPHYSMLAPPFPGREPLNASTADICSGSPGLPIGPSDQADHGTLPYGTRDW